MLCNRCWFTVNISCFNEYVCYMFVVGVDREDIFVGFHLKDLISSGPKTRVLAKYLYFQPPYFALQILTFNCSFSRIGPSQFCLNSND